MIFSALVTVTDLTAYASIGGTAIAVLAFAISLWTARIQRQHNKLSVRPLPEIQLRDMNGQILVKIINNGIGPLIINKLEVLEGGVRVGRSLIDIMPRRKAGWKFFVHVIDGRSIAPNGEIILLELVYDSSSVKDSDFSMLIRAALSDLNIHVTYKSVYDNGYPVYVKSLKWFGRLLTNEVRENENAKVV